MKIVSRLKKEESGQALIVVTIVLLLGAIVIPPMLNVNFAGTRSTLIHENRMLELYAADYGIEDALYQVQSELDGISSLTFGSAPYLTQTPSVNESDLDVTVEKVWLPEDLPAGYPLPVGAIDKSDKLVMVGMIETSIVEACWDDFETGGMGGGGGWLDPWTSAGHCSVWESPEAPQGDYHLECRGDLFTWGHAERAADLSGLDQPRLQFQARAGNFKPGDTYVCKIDPGGGNWTEVQRWEFGTANDTYSSYDVDLSGFPMTNDFTVRFEGNLTNGNSAIDTFEIGGSSGTWIGNWQGDYDITGAGSPYEGSRHLRIRGSNDQAWREVDLTGYGKPTLRFQAKVSSFESGDRAYLDVFDGSVWHNAVREWSDADDEGNYNPYEIDLSDYPYVGPGNYRIRFRDGKSSGWDYFYIDDLRIVDYSYFYVDDLTIGEEGNVYKVEIAYTDAAVGSAFMDRFGVWLPAGFEYVDVIEVNGMPDRDPDVITNNYKGGTALEWDYAGSEINLNDCGGLPCVRDITFTFKPSTEPKGVFSWLRTQEGYESWDRSCEIYKATSVASHEASGTSTRVEAYVAQGELNREAIVSYGNYLATGAPLLIDQNGIIDPDDDPNEIKEYRLDPTSGSATWWYDAGDDIWYTGRGTIDSAPDDGEVIGAWLYWAAFVEDDYWIGPDETVELLHPKRYYGEELGTALDGDGNNVFWTDNSPVTILPREETVYMTPKRYRGEYLGMASANVTNEEFWVNRTPIVTAPRAEYVYRNGSNLLTKDVDYAIDYTLGNVTIINPALSGNITIDYGAAGYDYPAQGADYTIDYPSGQITITNDELIGNVYVDYCAEMWTAVNHEAYNKYGMSLDPPEVNPGGGWTYACFADVTSVLEGTGNGIYAVRGVDSTDGDTASSSVKQRCFSGWSLVILYESPSETAHQLFIYDPIHQPADCAFMVAPWSTVDFTLENFYPPDGAVEGRLTYFVGEGDERAYEGDYIQIKGASESTYTTLDDPPTNPDDNAMNSVSTGGERGVDVDTFDVLEGDINIGDDTEANVRCETDGDRWYLIYMILSFKTEGVPKEEYSFTVGTLTYSYEVETGG
jgi:hypothetical protein